MGLFGTSAKAGRYGVLLDIGSGSVLAAIVHSDPTKKRPVVVWSKREHVPLKNTGSAKDSAKAVMTALINAAMTLDSEGRQVLTQYDPGATLTELQCGVSAPWSYTVTKSITYSKPQPFIITDDLLDHLTAKAEEKTSTELKHNESIQDLGLTIVDRATMNVKANGYYITHPQGQMASEIVLSHGSVVTQTHLLDALKEMRHKLFAQTKPSVSSYMLMLYNVIHSLQLDQRDYCAIDITFEATEIGIVRDGALQYCTHVPIGLFTVARQLAVETNASVHELYGHLKTGSIEHYLSTISPAKRTAAEEIIESYVAEVAELFTQTGDDLAIPKDIYVHTDLSSEAFALETMQLAATKALKSKPHITPISSVIVSTLRDKAEKKTTKADEALTVASLFFHTKKV